MVAPAVEATFRLLAALLSLTSSVRIVFAGRRRILPEDADITPPFDLVELPVVGFSRDEADRYLDGRQLPEAQRAGVLEMAALSEQGELRYSPFELSAWTSWAIEDPGLDLGAQRRGHDPFVESRIVGRINEHALLAALAPVAWLGRFDRSMIAPILVRHGQDPDATFERLAAEEWISVEARGPDGRPEVLEVDQVIQARLRAVVERQPARFPIDRSLLAGDLAALLDQQVDDCSADVAVALLRVSPSGEVFTRWSAVEAAIARERAWAWGRRVVPLVAGDVRDREEGGPSVLAAVLATGAACIAHQASAGAAEAWRSVLREVGRVPEPPAAERLRARAVLGVAAAATEPDIAAIDALAGADVPIGSLAGAAWNAADRASLSGETPIELDRVLWRMAASNDRDAETMAALILATRPGHGEALDDDPQSAPGDPSAWVDWPRPRHLYARLALARRLAGRAGAPAVPAGDSLRDVDAERLAAAELRAVLDERAPRPGELDELVEAEPRGVPPGTPGHLLAAPWHTTTRRRAG